MSFLSQINTALQRCNPTQKRIVGVVVPIVIVLLGYGIMTMTDGAHIFSNYYFPDCNPRLLKESWWGWMLVTIAIGSFECFWFKTQ